MNRVPTRRPARRPTRRPTRRTIRLTTPICPISKTRRCWRRFAFFAPSARSSTATPQAPALDPALPRTDGHRSPEGPRQGHGRGRCQSGARRTRRTRCTRFGVRRTPPRSDRPRPGNRAPKPLGIGLQTDQTATLGPVKALAEIDARIAREAEAAQSRISLSEATSDPVLAERPVVQPDVASPDVAPLTLSRLNSPTLNSPNPTSPGPTPPGPPSNSRQTPACLAPCRWCRLSPHAMLGP